MVTREISQGMLSLSPYLLAYLNMFLKCMTFLVRIYAKLDVEGGGCVGETLRVREGWKVDNFHTICALGVQNAANCRLQNKINLENKIRLMHSKLKRKRIRVLNNRNGGSAFIFTQSYNDLLKKYTYIESIVTQMSRFLTEKAV